MMRKKYGSMKESICDITNDLSKHETKAHVGGWVRCPRQGDGTERAQKLMRQHAIREEQSSVPQAPLTTIHQSPALQLQGGGEGRLTTEMS